MIKIQKLFLFFLFSTLVLSCSKSNDEKITGKWQVFVLRKNEEVIDFKDLNYLLIFEEDSIVKLKLDVNTCSGHYRIENSNIEFGYFGCTLLCCDNKLSDILIPEVRNAKNISIDNRVMKLKGNNQIFLIKIDN
jgi:heat shock protein HslJ